MSPGNIKTEYSRICLGRPLLITKQNGREWRVVVQEVILLRTKFVLGKLLRSAWGDGLLRIAFWVILLNKSKSKNNHKLLLASFCLGRQREYKPRISLWLSCSTCCGCTAQSWSDKLCCSYCRCSLHVASWLLILPSAICALSSLPTDPLSSACSSECLPWWLASNCCSLHLQLPSLLDWYCLPSDLIYRHLWSK